MSLIKLNIAEGKDNKFPFLNLGFRPFFLGAGFFSVLFIVVWYVFYIFSLKLHINHIAPHQWHSHEMIYGYSMAVIAGFLLTATKSWTGIQTLHGMSLFVLFSLWLLARIFIFFGLNVLAGISDLIFVIWLGLAIAIPIITVKQWRQLAVLSKLLALGVFNLLFYLGALKLMDNGIYLGTYGGFYLIIGLIMMMGRRVIPFFIERGVEDDIKLYNSKIIDLTSLALFFCFLYSRCCKSIQVSQLMGLCFLAL